MHAAGKRHHTNLGGTWKTTTHGGGEVLVMWGAADDDVLAGSLDGTIVRWHGKPFVAWPTIDPKATPAAKAKPHEALPSGRA